MYSDFYNFREEPFNLAPDPRSLFLAENHQEALASIIYGICERKGFISVTGEFGIGKTTLIRRVLEDVKGKKVHSVFLPRATFSIEQILTTIIRELGIAPGDAMKSSLVRQLNEFLLDRLPRNENLALIIDEAQDLDRAVMEELRLLSNLETSSAKLIQIVLVGQPELNEKLNSPELRQLRQRIVIRREVARLTGDECRRYIDHRLGLVGSRTSEVFTPEAVASIARHARGIPREINLLCHSALQMGHGLGQKKIDAKIVNQAIKKINRPPADETPFLGQELPAHESQTGDALGPALPVKKESLSEKLTGEPPAPASYRENAPAKTGESKAPGRRRRKSPGLKRPVMLLFGLACLLVVVLLGRGYLNETSENRGAVAPKIEPEKPAVTQTAPEPSPGINPQSASTAEPIQKTDEPKPVSAESAPTPPTSTASTRPRGPEILTVVVQTGDTISKFCQKYYRMTNTTLLDKILEFNGSITNLHLINVGQKIKIPKITEADLIFPASDGGWKIQVGTFSRSGYANMYRDERALRGKSLEIVPRKVSPRETWYRIFAGKFETEAEAQGALRALKEKGKLAIP